MTTISEVRGIIGTKISLEKCEEANKENNF